MLRLHRYEGPLCSVCSVGYYKLMLACRSCPSTTSIVGQSLLCFLTLGIVFAFLWWSGKRKAKNSNRNLRDVFLSNMKIVTGFFQVTAGIMNAFAFVEWPAYLADIGKFSEVFQLNVLQITPLQCINHSLGINVFQSMMFMLGMNASVVVVAVVVYLLVCGYVRVKGLGGIERQTALSKTRITLYRSTVVLLFIIFPGTCSSITRAIPCHTICRSEKDDHCPSYLKADYSIECNQSYSRKKILAYVSLGYIFLFPALAFVYLFKHFRKRSLNMKNKPLQTEEDVRNTANTAVEKANVFAQSLLSDDCKNEEHEANNFRRVCVSGYCETVLQGSGEEGRRDTQDLKETTVNVKEEIFPSGGSQSGERARSNSLSKALKRLVTHNPDEDEKQAATRHASTRETNREKFDEDAAQISPEVIKVDPSSEPELLQAVSFLYENFKSDAWYWELVETIRKVLLVSILGLIGSEGRAYVGLASIVSGLFAILFAKKQPMNKGFESRLQMLSLMVTFVNLATGVIMKIPSESTQDPNRSYLENIVVDVLLVTINLSLVAAVTGVLKKSSYKLESRFFRKSIIPIDLGIQQNTDSCALKQLLSSIPVKHFLE